MKKPSAYCKKESDNCYLEMSALCACILCLAIPPKLLRFILKAKEIHETSRKDAILICQC